MARVSTRAKPTKVDSRKPRFILSIPFGGAAPAKRCGASESASSNPTRKHGGKKIAEARGS